MSYCALMWSQVFAVQFDTEFDIQAWLNMKTNGVDLVTCSFLERGSSKDISANKWELIIHYDHYICCLEIYFISAHSE